MTAPMARLDRRLLNPTLSSRVADLAAIWADHTPAPRPVPTTCPTCGHPYSVTAPLCPSAAVVRPLLRLRRTPDVLDLLTDNQLQDLTGKRLSTALPEETRR